MGLTQNFAMTPPASVSGLYLAHPEARYFSVGKLDRAQVEDYARRKNAGGLRRRARARIGARLRAELDVEEPTRAAPSRVMTAPFQVGSHRLHRCDRVVRSRPYINGGC